MLDSQGEIGFMFAKMLSTILLLFVVSFALTMLYLSYNHRKLKTVKKHHLYGFREMLQDSPFHSSDEMLLSQMFSSQTIANTKKNSLPRTSIKGSQIQNRKGQKKRVKFEKHIKKIIFYDQTQPPSYIEKIHASDKKNSEKKISERKQA